MKNLAINSEPFSFLRRKHNLLIMIPTEVVEENETAIGKMCKDVFGKG